MGHNIGMRIALLCVGLLGCEAPQSLKASSTQEDPVPVVVPPAATPPVGSHELPDANTDFVAWLFDDTRMHQVDLTMELADAALLFDEPFEKVPGTAVIDGYDAREIGIRLRGKIGSFQEIDEKPKFKLDFNFINTEASFFGLKALALNNSVADCSYTREKLAYAVYAEAGLVVPRVTWANVTLNGEDYGLYQIVEPPDRQFLKRVMPNPDGNLYDAKYLWDGGWDTTMLDFDETVVQMILEEGVDVGNADVIAVAQAAHDGEQAGEWLAHTDPLIDWYSVQGMFAAEVFTDHWDGYAVGTNNYRVWIDPDTGLMELLPWDLDNSFNPLGWLAWHDWENPDSVLSAGCFADEACKSDLLDRLGSFLDTVEVIDWDAKLDDWYAITADAAAVDARDSCGPNTVLNNQWEIRNWMNDRPAELRAEWNLQ